MKKNPIRSRFCLCLRHDLDELPPELFQELISLEKNLGVRSTCFVLASQINNKNFYQLLLDAKTDDFDIQIHSEVKYDTNRYFLKKINTLWRILIFKYGNQKMIEKYYAKYLELNATNLKNKLNFYGHAPHSNNCYLKYDTDKNWDIIEAATLKAGFKWLSDYRDILKVRWGEEFLSPRPPYKIINNENKQLVVFPTSWDDQYMFKYKSVDAPTKTTQEGQRSILKQIEYCKKHQIPCVINLHPIHFLKDNPRYLISLIENVVNFCRKNNIEISTLNKLFIWKEL